MPVLGGDGFLGHHAVAAARAEANATYDNEDRAFQR
jgi:hypothetical protein